MKENVVDVLLYLFENYIDTDDVSTPDKITLETELEQAGFPSKEINKALEWLESMTVLADGQSAKNISKDQGATRIYSDSEAERLDVQCRGYLLFLEQISVLDADTREIVIERVLALDTEEVDLDQLKWVVLMVLFYQPGREEAYAWMEDLVFDDLAAVVH
jgi:Smg protein